VLTLGLAVSATQCSLTTSVDGLSGGSAPDAGSAGDAGGSADAPLGDGALLDATVVDAGSDAGRFCASLTTQPSFCDDFDDEGPFSTWTTSDVGAGGSAVRDRSAAVSAPNSLLTTSAVSAVSVPALLGVASPTPVHRVRIAYDLRVEARDPQTAYAEVGYIRVGPSDARAHAFYMRLYADPALSTSFTAEAYLPDGGISQKNFNPVINPQFTKWTRVAVDYDLRAAPRVEVSIDGMSAGQTALDATIFTPGFASVEVGLGYTGHPMSAAWQLRYDNVTVDWTP
jgi:hypothetical protein